MWRGRGSERFHRNEQAVAARANANGPWELHQYRNLQGVPYGLCIQFWVGDWVGFMIPFSLLHNA